jgi:hypothetical protein
MKTRTPQRLAVLSGTAALMVLVMAGCGPRSIGQAVVLWGPPEGPDSGALLPVTSRSTIDSTVTLWDRVERKRLVLDTWRVAEYRQTAEAERHRARYEPYLGSYAFTDRTDGLPLRESPDTQSRRVSRIAPAQLLKVLGSSAEKATEGSLEAYWYEILTDDGYRGYCFGYYLRVFEATPGEERARMQAILLEDPTEDLLFSGVWRPEYFADMLRAGRIDLTRFSPEIGLFPDRQASTWRLRLHDLDTTLPFERVDKPAAGVYEFPPTGLRIVVHPGNRMEVTYRKGGRTSRTVFVMIEEDVEEVVERERDRRKELVTAFLSRGRDLASSAYGAIRLNEDGAFWWAGFERVPRGVFARDVTGTGRIDFAYHVASALRGAYAGAVSFVFDEYRPGEATVFLYNYVAGGLQLTRALPQDIEDLEIKRVTSSPLVLFFSFQDT